MFSKTITSKILKGTKNNKIKINDKIINFGLRKYNTHDKMSETFFKDFFKIGQTYFNTKYVKHVTLSSKAAELHIVGTSDSYYDSYKNNCYKFGTQEYNDVLNMCKFYDSQMNLKFGSSANNYNQKMYEEYDRVKKLSDQYLNGIIKFNDKK